MGEKGTGKAHSYERNRGDTSSPAREKSRLHRDSEPDERHVSRDPSLPTLNANGPNGFDRFAFPHSRFSPLGTADDTSLW